MKEILKQLDRMIQDREPEIYLNLINCGNHGKNMIKKLENAGYLNTSPGHPQPVFVLPEYFK